MAKRNLVEAINSGLRVEMEKDPSVIILGEDVGKEGGVFRVTDGLLAKFGQERVFDTPLAESGIVGVAIGMAVKGLRPVAEIQFEGFLAAGDGPDRESRLPHQESLQGSFYVPARHQVPVGGRDPRAGTPLGKPGGFLRPHAGN